jgi:CHRD domain
VHSLGDSSSDDSGSLEPLHESHSATLFMTGQQMVPPVNGDAVTTLTLAYFQAGGYLSWTLDCDVADVTELMFHGPAFEDATAPMIKSFSLAHIQDNSAYGDFEVDEFAGELLRGSIYAVLHTESAPEGLLRAQVVLLDHDFANDESPVDFGQQTVLKPVNVGIACSRGVVVYCSVCVYVCMCVCVVERERERVCVCVCVASTNVCGYVLTILFSFFSLFYYLLFSLSLSLL